MDVVQQLAECVALLVGAKKAICPMWHAIRQLKELLRCNRLVVFGDGKNDVDMFEQADESYAVANAVDELKAVSTSVIDSNENDGVAKWLLENAKFGADADE